MKIRDASVKDVIETISKIDTSLMSSKIGEYTLSELWHALNMITPDKRGVSIMEFIEYHNLNIPDHYLDMEICREE